MQNITFLNIQYMLEVYFVRKIFLLQYGYYGKCPLNVYSSVGKLTSLKFLRSKYLLPPQNPSWKGLPASFPPFLRHFFCYLKLADTIARYKNRNLKPKNRIGRLKNRNSKRTDTIGRFKNWNLASTDCFVRYNRKIDQSDLSPTSAYYSNFFY
jgi:hypothetical protein